VPRRLAQKLMLSLTIIVVIVAAISGLINVKTEERQLLNSMILGADQLSKAITSSTWHSMLADRREDAYQVMQTIALKQGIDRIRISSPFAHFYETLWRKFLHCRGERLVASPAQEGNVI
jgi:hypothetical protein